MAAAYILLGVDGHPPVVGPMGENTVDGGRMGFHGFFISTRKADHKRPARLGNRPFPPQTAVLRHEQPFRVTSGRSAPQAPDRSTDAVKPRKHRPSYPNLGNLGKQPAADAQVAYFAPTRSVSLGRTLWVGRNS